MPVTQEDVMVIHDVINGAIERGQGDMKVLTFVNVLNEQEDDDSKTLSIMFYYFVEVFGVSLDFNRLQEEFGKFHKAAVESHWVPPVDDESLGCGGCPGCG